MFIWLMSSDGDKGPCELKPMQNFITLGQPLLGEKYPEQIERKRKSVINRGHYFLPVMPKGSSCSSHGPKSNQNIFVELS